MRTASNLQQHCFPPLNRNIHVDFYIDGESDGETLRQRDAQYERETFTTTVREREYFDEDGDIQHIVYLLLARKSVTLCIILLLLYKIGARVGLFIALHIIIVPTYIDVKCEHSKTTYCRFWYTRKKKYNYFYQHTYSAIIMALKKIQTNNFPIVHCSDNFCSTIKVENGFTLHFEYKSSNTFYSPFKFQSYLYTPKCKYPQTSD